MALLSGLIVPRGSEAHADGPGYTAVIHGRFTDEVVLTGRTYRVGSVYLPEETLAKTVEAHYRLTRVGWQLEHITIAGLRFRTDGELGKNTSTWRYGRQIADHPVDGTLADAPPQVLAWALKHNPGLFDAVNFDQNNR